MTNKIRRLKFCKGEECKTLISYYPKNRKYCKICKKIEHRNQNLRYQKEAGQRLVVDYYIPQDDGSYSERFINDD